MHKLLLISFLISVVCFGCENGTTEQKAKKQEEKMYSELKFDWQGHRGARGLLPENANAGFIKAMELGVNTLELDVVISKDKQVVVSHDPFMSSKICLDKNGQIIEDEKAMNIYQMDYAEVRACDCGSIGNERFPDQIKQPASKPLLKEVIMLADHYKKVAREEKVRFNIEIKSRPSWYNSFCPEPEEYVDLFLKDVGDTLDGRLSIQSFDINILEELNKRKGDFKTVFLVENTEGFKANLEKLTFIPDIYSPYYLFVTKEMVETLHEKGMKIIPWTVNEEEAMQKLIDLGVDGIITDYPDKIKNFKK